MLGIAPLRSQCRVNIVLSRAHIVRERHERSEYCEEGFARRGNLILNHKTQKKRTVAVNRQSSLLKHTYEINFLLIELTLGWA